MTACLWDLRASLESQMRCLTKIHRWVDDLPATDEHARKRLKQEIVQNLAEIRDIAGVVRETATATIDTAGQIL